jgi:hypothetical protein
MACLAMSRKSILAALMNEAPGSSSQYKYLIANSTPDADKYVASLSLCATEAFFANLGARALMMQECNRLLISPNSISMSAKSLNDVSSEPNDIEVDLIMNTAEQREALRGQILVKGSCDKRTWTTKSSESQSRGCTRGAVERRRKANEARHSVVNRPNLTKPIDCDALNANESSWMYVRDHTVYTNEIKVRKRNLKGFKFGRSAP